MYVNLKQRKIKKYWLGNDLNLEQQQKNKLTVMPQRMVANEKGQTQLTEACVQKRKVGNKRIILQMPLCGSSQENTK